MSELVFLRSGTKVLFGLVYMTALQGKKNSRDVKQDNSSPENLFSLGNSEWRAGMVHA